MADDFEDWEGPEFEPGWPDLLPLGLIIARSAAMQRDHEGDIEIPDEDDVRWAISLGVAETAPRLAFIGDLTVSNPAAFAGITVLMPFCLRDEGKDLDRGEREGILQQYGRWASSVMYDHAATSCRAMLAGNGLPITIPYGTPEVLLHLDDEGDDESEN